MLDAKMNVEYWRLIVNRYDWWDMAFKIILAILSSASVAGFHIWKKDGVLNWSLGWSILTGLGAIVGVALPFLKFDEIARTAAELRGKWCQIENDYNKLWLKRNAIKETTLQTYLADLKKQQTEKTSEESTMPQSKPLLKQAYNDVCQSMGLTQD